jgi:hypothetical protein
MRYFIHTLIDDFWTAVKNDRIIESNLKPHPYKEYRELTETELIIWRGWDFIIIFFSSDHHGTYEERKVLQWKSMENDVAEEYPELAKKHNLTLDRSHEYWRKK